MVEGEEEGGGEEVWERDRETKLCLPLSFPSTAKSQVRMAQHTHTHTHTLTHTCTHTHTHTYTHTHTQIAGSQVKDVFQASGLPQQQLAHIWCVLYRMYIYYCTIHIYSIYLQLRYGVHYLHTTVTYNVQYYMYVCITKHGSI